MGNEELQIPPPNIVLQPTGDVALLKEASGVVQKESYAVIPKNRNKNDYMRPVKMSDLIKIRDEAISISKQGIKWDEIALGFSTLGFGASLSALASSVALNSALGVLFFIACPVLSFSLIVFVVMYKVLRRKTARNSAGAIIDIIEQYEETAWEAAHELK